VRRPKCSSVGCGPQPPSRTPTRCGTLPAVTLLTELDAFFTDHHHCGDLDCGVEGEVVWIACDCGARIARRVNEGDAFAFDG
jgi:hypothetical protein